MSIFSKKNKEDSSSAKAMADKKDEKKQATADVKDDKTVSSAKKKISMKDLYDSDGKVKEVKTSKKGEVKSTKFSEGYKVLVKPLITEKAAQMNTVNKYIFEVGIKSNKISVAKVIEQVYGVKPEQVNIINQQGKVVRKGRTSGKRKNWKKAIVTLPKGKSIQIYEGV